MRTLIVFAITCLLATPSLAFDRGFAYSKDEYWSVLNSCGQEVEDLNRYVKDPRKKRVGYFVFCVNRHNRGKIMWTFHTLLFEENAGVVLAHHRRWARKHGGCYAEPSVMKLKMSVDSSIAQARIERQRAIERMKEDARAIAPYLNRR